MARTRLLTYGLWCGVGVAMAAGAVYLYVMDPHQPGRFPSCPFFAMTGWHCPGCGSLRALHCLVHGQPLEAASRNILALVLLPIAAYGAVLDLARGGRISVGRFSFSLPPLPYRTPLVLLVVILGYWLLRNLPWYPFTLLAPQASHSINPA